MKKSAYLFSSLLIASTAYAEEPTSKAEDVAKISEAFGHMIGKNLDNIGLTFDIAQVIKGLQDETAGKESPMTEAECIQAISAIQAKLFQEQCTTNLTKAETFLEDNQKSENIVAIESGKVQYKVEQPGTGPAIEDHFSPLIRYTGKYLDGSVFGEAKEEEKISLDEMIPGLKAGLIGMKEGEKRIIYIHPDLAYGTHGYLPPNSLLTFEIEVIKANAPLAEDVESVSSEGPAKSGELAESETHVR